MRRAIVVGAIAVIALGAGVYLLTRPSADIDDLTGYYTRGWGGAHALDKNVTPPSRYGGTGTVVASFTVHNLRDHAVKLAVPKGERDVLAQHGIRADVRFFPLSRERGYGDYNDEADLAGGSATMPANADGEIVHIFHVERCLPSRTSMPATFALETDGHPARTEVTRSADHHELWTYERELHDKFGGIDLGTC